MQVNFTPEQEACFLEAVQAGIDAADRGELVEESEMDEVVEKILRRARCDSA